MLCDGVLSKADFGREDRERYQVDVGEGVTVRLCVDAGQVALYASDTITTPNGALNTFSFEGALQDEPKCEDLFVDPIAIESNRGIPIRGRKRQVTTPNEKITLYISIEGVADNSSFIFETFPGNSSICKQRVLGNFKTPYSTFF